MCNNYNNDDSCCEAWYVADNDIVYCAECGRKIREVKNEKCN